MNRGQLRLASSLLAAVAAGWAVIMAEHGQVAASLFSAAAAAVLTVCYGTTFVEGDRR